MSQDADSKARTEQGRFLSYQAFIYITKELYGLSFRKMLFQGKFTLRVKSSARFWQNRRAVCPFEGHAEVPEEGDGVGGRCPGPSRSEGPGAKGESG